MEFRLLLFRTYIGMRNSKKRGECGGGEDGQDTAFHRKPPDWLLRRKEAGAPSQWRNRTKPVPRRDSGDLSKENAPAQAPAHPSLISDPVVQRRPARASCCSAVSLSWPLVMPVTRTSPEPVRLAAGRVATRVDRKSTRLNSSH